MEITITIKDPDIEYTQDQLDEWIMFASGYSGCIKMSNPLHELDFEIIDVDYH